MEMIKEKEGTIHHFTAANALGTFPVSVLTAIKSRWCVYSFVYLLTHCDDMKISHNAKILRKTVGFHCCVMSITQMNHK